MSLDDNKATISVHKDPSYYQQNGETNNLLQEEKINMKENTDLMVEVIDDRNTKLLYSAADHPPIYLTVFCGLQVLLLNVIFANMPRVYLPLLI